MYKDFYENFVPMDSGYTIIPQLIIVCEDELHTKEVFKEIVTAGVEISKIKLYFTTDLRQIEENLGKTLLEFKLDEASKKYKVEDVELKLLD